MGRGSRLHPSGVRPSSIAEELWRGHYGHSRLGRCGLAQDIRLSGKPFHEGDLMLVFQVVASMWLFPCTPHYTDRGQTHHLKANFHLTSLWLVHTTLRMQFRPLAWLARPLPPCPSPAPLTSPLEGLHALFFSCLWGSSAPCGTVCCHALLPTRIPSPNTHISPMCLGSCHDGTAPTPSPSPTPTPQASVS